jgi:hypothetical protein
MFAIGSGPLMRIRQVVDPEEAARMKPDRVAPAYEAPSEAELANLVTATRPWLITLIGGGGLAIILWLMMFKPF